MPAISPGSFEDIEPSVGVEFEHGYDVHLTMQFYVPGYEWEFVSSTDRTRFKMPLTRRNFTGQRYVFRIEIKPPAMTSPACSARCDTTSRVTTRAVSRDHS
jgi:hypothetical protein